MKIRSTWQMERYESANTLPCAWSCYKETYDMVEDRRGTALWGVHKVEGYILSNFRLTKSKWAVNSKIILRDYLYNYDY